MKTLLRLAVSATALAACARTPSTEATVTTPQPVVTTPAAPAVAILTPRTTWDAVYTTAQAAHGQAVFETTCVKCHGAALQGGDDGAPLAGSEFMNSWKGNSLDKLYNVIHMTMPPTAPGTVPAQDVADIVTYILSRNGMPAGSATLPADPTQLKLVTLTATRP